MDIGLWITSVKTGISALSSIQSNEVLRERIAFIYEQMDIIQKAHVTTQEELAQAKAKIKELEDEISAYRAKEQFIQHEGATFRKDPSGNYIRAVYCPNCLKHVGAAFPQFPFQCHTCGWLSSFKKQSFNHIFNSLP